MIVMIMVMMMAAAARVGAGLGIERGIDLVDMTAEALDHLLDHMIGADTDAVTQQLHGQMAVAEVPGDPHQFPVVVRMDFQQGFRPSADSYDATFDRQAVAVPQADGLRQVDQQVGILFGVQHYAPAMPMVEVDQHAVDLGGRIPRPGRQNLMRAPQNRK